MLLMIDNYDSFTYNLVQYFYELGQEVKVYRNDQINIEQIRLMQPDKICISPGPGNPTEAGISLQVIKNFMSSIPVLGVCLGHQAIAQLLGANIIPAKKIMHGKISTIKHNKNNTLFKNLPDQIKVTRYHSLAVEKNNLPSELSITAQTDDEEIMALEHKTLKLYGVQFHPEAILSEYGHVILNNFLQA